MEPFARVLMFIQGRSVKPPQTVRIGREMSRHPVQQDAQPLAVRRLDEGAEFRRGAVADRGGIQAHRLIAPASIEGKFRNRHQLDMGEAHIGHVTDKLLGQFQIAEHPVARRPPPAAQMHLID